MNLPDFNSADLNEIRRLLQSIAHTGKVSMIDTAVTPPCVRVESGSLHTDWIPWTTSRAAGVSHSGRHSSVKTCCCWPLGGDTGNARVIGSLYTEDNLPPERSLDKTVTVYPDGARIEYDHASSTLTATLPGQAIVTADGAVTVEAKGNVEVSSAASITAKAPQSTHGIITAAHIFLNKDARNSFASGIQQFATKGTQLESKAVGAVGHVINIAVNGAGNKDDALEIGREVKRQLQNAMDQLTARGRSGMADRG